MAKRWILKNAVTICRVTGKLGDNAFPSTTCRAIILGVCKEKFGGRYI